MKRAEIIEMVKDYGKQYGYTYNEKTGLRYEPEKLGLSIIKSKWDLINDISMGDEKAKQLAKGLRTISLQDINRARHQIQNRTQQLSDIELEYQGRNLEILDKQRKRLLENRDITSSILNVENIYRESTEEAFRQTPLERGSVEGIKERVDKSLEQINKAVQSHNFASKVSFVDKDYLNVARNIIEELELDIDLDSLIEEYKIAYGDPYKAIEKAFMEVGESVQDVYSEMDREERQDLLSNDEVRAALIAMDVIDVSY